MSVRMWNLYNNIFGKSNNIFGSLQQHIWEFTTTYLGIYNNIFGRIISNIFGSLQQHIWEWKTLIYKSFPQLIKKLF